MNVISNTSYIIDPSIEDVWLFWIKETYIPLVKQTDLCEVVRLFKLQKIEEDHDNTFAIQIDFLNDTKLHLYNNKYKSQFDSLMLKRFGNTVTAFRTILHEF